MTHPRPEGARKVPERDGLTVGNEKRLACDGDNVLDERELVTERIARADDFGIHHVEELVVLVADHGTDVEFMLEGFGAEGGGEFAGVVGGSGRSVVASLAGGDGTFGGKLVVGEDSRRDHDIAELLGRVAGAGELVSSEQVGMNDIVDIGPVKEVVVVADLKVGLAGTEDVEESGECLAVTDTKDTSRTESDSLELACSLVVSLQDELLRLGLGIVVCVKRLGRVSKSLVYIDQIVTIVHHPCTRSENQLGDSQLGLVGNIDDSLSANNIDLVVDFGTKTSNRTGSMIDDYTFASFTSLETSFVANLYESFTERRFGGDVAGVVVDLFNGIAASVEIKDGNVLLTALTECKSNAGAEEARATNDKVGVS